MHKTQQETADLLGVTEPQISFYENGRNDMPGSAIGLTLEHYGSRFSNIDFAVFLYRLLKSKDIGTNAGKNAKRTDRFTLEQETSGDTDAEVCVLLRYLKDLLPSLPGSDQAKDIVSAYLDEYKKCDDGSYDEMGGLPFTRSKADYFRRYAQLYDIVGIDDETGEYLYEPIDDDEGPDEYPYYP